MDCDARTFTYVGSGQKCCDSTSAGNCARDVSGCTAFLGSGVIAGLTQDEAIGVGVGVAVFVILVVGLSIYGCTKCCKKKKDDNFY